MEIVEKSENFLWLIYWEPCNGQAIVTLDML